MPRRLWETLQRRAGGAADARLVTNHTGLDHPWVEGQEIWDVSKKTTSTLCVGRPKITRRSLRGGARSVAGPWRDQDEEVMVQGRPTAIRIPM